MLIHGEKIDGGYEKPLTIKEVIENIDSNYFLIPSIQRKFVWSSEQIEMLFDSIMRGYPINSFLFWLVKDPNIKDNYKFYKFLNKYTEYYGEDNEDINTMGMRNFIAVVDGQQRLTSLYIGLKGTYAYKIKGKRWSNRENFPDRKLYINLIDNRRCTIESSNEQDEKNVDNLYGRTEGEKQYNLEKLYDLKFLTNNQVPDNEEKNVDSFYFPVGKILSFRGYDSIKKYLYENFYNKLCKQIGSSETIENGYPYKVLKRLYDVVYKEKLINYFLETSSDIDKVLDIFVRTNSGGSVLSSSDILMSIISSNWRNKDARKEFKDLTKDVFEVGNCKFYIDKDFIIKVLLFIYNEKDLRFKATNFDYSTIIKFEKNWDNVRDCIISTFKLLDQLGFDDSTFRAKSIAIPIVYYIMKNDLSNSIISPIYDNPDNKINISRWIILSNLKAIFSGNSDTVLRRIKDVLNNSEVSEFPIDLIEQAFEKDPVKNYRFDEEILDNIIYAKKGSNVAYYVLHLLYPNLDYFNQEYHQDHMHPADFFTNSKKIDKLPNDIKEFAKDENNWNTIANLQLLNGRINESKQAMDLKTWAEKNRKSNRDMLISDNTSLEIDDFKIFIEDRRKNIKNILRDLLIIKNT